MPTKKRAGKTSGTRIPRKAVAQLDGKPAAGVKLGASEPEAVAAPRRPLKISTVSHTLDTAVAEQLRTFAFHERVSESAVIEYALREFFKTGEDAALGRRLRESGAALRRRT